MTDEEVLAAAYAEGFELDERVASYTGDWAWGWHRGDDDRWPCVSRNADRPSSRPIAAPAVPEPPIFGLG
jgi:hypothetical protein